MRIYKSKNVYDETLERMRYIFSEFPEVVVGFSGGKDSTVTLHMAKTVARELNRLPLKVMFIDQELEWKSTIDLMEDMLEDPELDFKWYQIPFRITNSTSDEDRYLHCWGEGEDWAREKHPGSIHENKYGVDRFKELYAAIIDDLGGGGKACYVSGVRAEESPARAMAMTLDATYQWITYGKKLNEKKGQYTFYPLYDWGYKDIWKCIHDNELPYNRLYDSMYNYGIPVHQMRVSNYTHETATNSLFFIQEVEPETYAAATQRLRGVDTAGKLGKEDFYIKDLPFMFASWREYRNFLTEKLLPDDTRPKFIKKFMDMDAIFAGKIDDKSYYRTQIQTIIAKDISFIKLDNWSKTGKAFQVKSEMKGKAWY